MTLLHWWQRVLLGPSDCHLYLEYCGSMLIYRVFFHRLNRFPGPFLARLSNFSATGLSSKDLHLYEEVQKLHKKYGDVVQLDKKQWLSHLIQFLEKPRINLHCMGPQSYQSIMRNQ